MNQMLDYEDCISEYQLILNKAPTPSNQSYTTLAGPLYGLDFWLMEPSW